MRFCTTCWLMATTFLLWGCNRLPELGDTGQACFGNGTCAEGSNLICTQDNRCCPPEGCQDETCQIDCHNKCGGAPDGCGGVCNANCPLGLWCNNQQCEKCNNESHCGTSCKDCQQKSINTSCVNDGAGWQCGCLGPQDCNGKSCQDYVCSTDDTCTPACSGKCNGADDNCGGQCWDTCKTGTWCDGKQCVDCQHDHACGKDCNDCTVNMSNTDCVQDPNDQLWRCGCYDPNDCLGNEICDTNQYCKTTNDDCGGTCSSDQWCNAGSCQNCDADYHCGPNCNDCSFVDDGHQCIWISTGYYACGCDGAEDCNAGDYCDGQFCKPEDCTMDCEGKCGGAPSGCGPPCEGCPLGQHCKFEVQTCYVCSANNECGPDCIDCTQMSTNFGCIFDTNTNDWRCGCNYDSDCSAGAPCIQADKKCNNACQPDCYGRCGGAGDSCGGYCYGECSAGYHCLSGTCLPCESDTACGGDCIDCTSTDSMMGTICIYDDYMGNHRCGCRTTSECMQGECMPEGYCDMGPMPMYFLHSNDTCEEFTSLALSSNVEPLYQTILAVGCGGTGNSAGDIRIWAIDENVGTPDPDFDSTLAHTHNVAISSLHFNFHSYELLSTDISGQWFYWPHDGTTWTSATNVDARSASFARWSNENYIATIEIPANHLSNLYNDRREHQQSYSLGGTPISLGFTPGAKILVIASENYDQNIQAMLSVDVKNGTNSHSFAKGHNVIALAFPNNIDTTFQMVSYSEEIGFGSFVNFWADLSNDPPVNNQLSVDENNVTCMALTKDDNFLFLGTSDGRLVCYDANTHDRCVNEVTLPNVSEKIRAIVISQDSRWLATLTSGEIQVWDLPMLRNYMTRNN